MEKIVAAAQYSEDVVADLMQLLVEGSASMNLFAEDISVLSSEIAKLVPDRSFSVRGWGESVRDVWLRDYDGGKEIFSLGPPEGAV